MSRRRRRLATQVEDVLLRGDWPGRLARRLGLQNGVQLRELEVGVPPARDGEAGPLRIGFASDFHIGPLTDWDLLRDACRNLAGARPDVLLLGGDFVDMTARRLDRLIPHLLAVPAPAGRFAVLGNHDWWTDPEEVLRALTEAGIPVLSNRNVRLPPPFDWAWICGLDDYLAGAHAPDEAFVGATGCRIVLMHEPSSLLTIGRRRFDVALSGHTHGGQIALPGGVPLILPAGPLSRRYSRGRHSLPSGATLVVTTGVGFTGLPIRFFAAPEIVLCEVRPLPGSDGTRPAGGTAP